MLAAKTDPSKPEQASKVGGVNTQCKLSVHINQSSLRGRFFEAAFGTTFALALALATPFGAFLGEALGEALGRGLLFGVGLPLPTAAGATDLGDMYHVKDPWDAR